MHASDHNSPVFVGIDWADREHALCIARPDGATARQTLEHTPEAIAAWVAQVRGQFPKRPIRVALEQSKGALVNALRQFAELELYPINPKQLARYRDAVYPSGSKDDPHDAELLARFLMNHQEQLRPDAPLDDESRRLDELSLLRRKLVDDRKTLWQKLESTLKQYFPQLRGWCPGKSWEGVLLAVIRRWPSLAELKRAHPRILRRFLGEHGVSNEQEQTEWINNIRPAQPLTGDACLIEPRTQYAQNIARQIEQLNQGIAEFDERLEEAAANHPDAQLFRSLPGAGKVMAPRLMAAFGSDRGQYESAEQIQAKSGIAPITKQSGKTRFVLKRYACPKYLRQTFHEFAEFARRFSDWSRAFYKMKRAAGMKHNAAIRALAYKWIRIIFRVWQTRIPYSETRYIEQLRQKNSPVINFLETNENPAETP
jgi:transposase